tara:strand:+ start:364 stop:528 length:165 start_codon:yes stop_codon:yes gene_type:complete
LKKTKNEKERENDWKTEDDDNTFYSLDYPEEPRDARESDKGLEEATDLHEAGVH